jgi:proteic killer suppression protein
MRHVVIHGVSCLRVWGRTEGWRWAGGPDLSLQRAWRKLAMLDAAETLADLTVPLGNRLEKLAGNRAGSTASGSSGSGGSASGGPTQGPEDVEITGYHEEREHGSGHGHGTGASW